MKLDKELSQNKQEEPMSVTTRSLVTGFTGGIIWSALGLIMYFFSFSEVAPRSYVLRSWITAEWTSSWLGNILSIIIIGLLSLVSAFIYFGLFRKVNTLWMGVTYGLILWVIIFYILQPVFPNVPDIENLNSNTIVSTICLFILYGTFIGYSISYDYADNNSPKEKNEEET
ncbi:YqhR family membrane protein [Virgibacillus siamensis]|uniref:YqhR family membrane protein n=1 Tax=Virgibacillus siamensis TaxID=480071 RepID=UPI000987C42E|nr:YqhR family membrane protein [Virgibacillus siamensis]